MAGALGTNYVAQIFDTSVSPSALVTVACQGDLTFNTGESLEVSRTKNCKHPFFRSAGYSATFTIELETPMDATHTAILTQADAQTEASMSIITTDTGAPTWTGNGFVAYDPLTAPTEGPATLQVTFAWTNDPTRGAAS